MQLKKVQRDMLACAQLQNQGSSLILSDLTQQSVSSTVTMQKYQQWMSPKSGNLLLNIGIQCKMNKPEICQSRQKDLDLKE